MTSPVLIYGPRKSGSTLLQSLLDGGDDIMMVPGELKLKKIYDKDFLSPIEKKQFYITHGRSIFSSLWSLSSNNKLVFNREVKIGTLDHEQIQSKLYLQNYKNSLIKNFSHKNITIKDLIDNDIKNFEINFASNVDNYKYWGSKEVGSDPRRILPFFKALYPNAKFVFIVRNPDFIIRSILRERRRKHISLSIYEILKECYEAYSLLKFFIEAKNWNDCVMVFYDELIENPNLEIKRITKYLEINFDDVYKKPTTLGINTKVHTSSKNTRTIFSTPVENWKDGLTYKEIFTIKLFHGARILASKFSSREFPDYKKASKYLKG